MTTQEAAALLDLEDGVYELSTPWIGMIKQPTSALVASGFPVKPPRQWFDNPNFRELTPLSIDRHGRVSGHIAGWRSDHIGLSAGVKPPRSKSGYAFFMTGALETDEGEFINVGQITLTGGHAPIEASVADAVAHYDNTQSAIMDVAAGEDRHGIWVAGALRPDVTDAQLRAIRASSVSGDWRPINGRLELVAICSVNCPGFPIPRARVASGVPVALIAAGTGAIIEKLIKQQGLEAANDVLVAGLEMLNDRLNRIEQQMFDVELAPAAYDKSVPEELEESEEFAASENDSPQSEHLRQRRAEHAARTAEANNAPKSKPPITAEEAEVVETVAEPVAASAGDTTPPSRAKAFKAKRLRARVASISTTNSDQIKQAQATALRQRVHNNS